LKTLFKIAASPSLRNQIPATGLFCKELLIGPTKSLRTESDHCGCKFNC